jgi:putative SOS response-associated peptidase YedK
MCGRYVAASSPALLADRFAVDEVDPTVGEAPAPDYNVSPRSDVLVVRQRDDRRVLSRVRWGLVPPWAESAKVGDRMINARAETVATKPAYRRAFAKKRCIVPADGFYEWKRDETPTDGRPRKRPYFVHRRDGEPLALAGLWEVWKVPEDSEPDLGGDDGWLRSCVIVTTTANDALAHIHDRMPVVLPEAAWERWLDPDMHDADALEQLLAPAPSEWFEVYEVSTRVNSVRNNDAELVHPVDA